MEAFDYPNHQVQHAHPVSGAGVQLGGSYRYDVAPTSPDARVFTLSFETMAWHFNQAGSVDATVEPQTNLLNLSNFYEAHKLYKKFTYDHPVFGVLTVKFNKPLEIPKGIKKGNGWSESFTVELLEVP